MNNNLHSSSKARCNCGRYMSLGEDNAGVSHIGYKCPDCVHRQYSKPLTREEYYEQFSRVFS
jgi:hypothetical protein